MENLLCLTTASGEALAKAAQQTSAFDFTAVFIIISLIISIAVPITILILGKVKFHGSFKMTLFGLLGFIVFFVILPSLIAGIIMPHYSSQTGTYIDASIYLCIRIVLLEIGRFVILFLRRKKNNTFGDGIMLGAGYCLLDTFIIIAGYLIPYLIVVISPNVGQIDGIWRELLVFVKAQNLSPEKAWRFLTYGMTSFAFGAMHLFSSILIYLAVNKKEKWLCIVALIADVCVLIPNKLSSFDVVIFGKEFFIIPYMLIIAIVIYLLSYVFYKKIGLRREDSIDMSYFDKLKK